MSKYKVYLSPTGTVARTEQEGAIFSRANLVNTLVVFSPLPSDYLIRAGFTRADGVQPHSAFLYYVGQREGYSCYEYNLTGYQLGVPGALAISLDIFKANQDEKLTTATFTVQVGQSFAPVVEDEPDDDAYTSQIETAMSMFQEAIDSLGTTEVDDYPQEGSANPVSSGGVYTALQAKQDTLTAGEGITIVDGVISATGGGSSGGTSGSKIVTYRDPEYETEFTVTFPQEMASVDDIAAYLLSQGHEYGGNTYEVSLALWNGSTTGSSAGIYAQRDSSTPLLYLYVSDYGEDVYLNNNCFNFGDGGYSAEMTTYAMYISDTYCLVDAPKGLTSGEDLYNWLLHAGYTDYDSGLDVDAEGYYGIVMIADSSYNAIRLMYTTGEELTSCLASEVIDFYDYTQP